MVIIFYKVVDVSYYLIEKRSRDKKGFIIVGRSGYGLFVFRLGRVFVGVRLYFYYRRFFIIIRVRRVGSLMLSYIRECFSSGL